MSPLDSTTPSLFLFPYITLSHSNPNYDDEESEIPIPNQISLTLSSNQISIIASRIVQGIQVEGWGFHSPEPKDPVNFVSE
jgi:hypothetical protein